MTIHNRYAVLFILICFGCNKASKIETVDSVAHTSLKTDTISDSQSLGASSSKKDTTALRSFTAFFGKFKSDSIFQREHVLFPSTIMSWEFDSENPKVDSLTAEEWRFLDFFYDESYTKRPYDKYTQELDAENDSGFIRLRGIDNGIHIDYEFKRVDGAWYFVGWKDYSD
jgi:hypothetical protein